MKISTIAALLTAAAMPAAASPLGSFEMYYGDPGYFDLEDGAISTGGWTEFADVPAGARRMSLWLSHDQLPGICVAEYGDEYETGVRFEVRYSVEVRLGSRRVFHQTDYGWFDEYFSQDSDYCVGAWPFYFEVNEQNVSAALADLIAWPDVEVIEEFEILWLEVDDPSWTFEYWTETFGFLRLDFFGRPDGVDAPPALALFGLGLVTLAGLRRARRLSE